MGNCANKPLTTEGDAPAEAPEQKVAVEEREIEVDQNKVPSLAQMLEVIHFIITVLFYFIFFIGGNHGF